jgi:hypothetical protein
LIIYLPTGFFYTAAAFVAGFFLVSSSEDSSELSSLDTAAAFLLTTAFYFSSFLGYFSVALAPLALASDCALLLLAPTCGVALTCGFFFLSSSELSSSDDS